MFLEDHLQGSSELEHLMRETPAPGMGSTGGRALAGLGPVSTCILSDGHSGKLHVGYCSRCLVPMFRD